MSKLILLLFIFILFNSFVSSGSHYRKFASTTSYFENANSDTSPVSVQGCEPAYLWFLARHGARTPNRRVIEQMQTHLPALRDRIVAAADIGRLEKKTLKLFETWNLNITKNDSRILVKSGTIEHEELGWRWRRRLDGLLNDADGVLVRTIKQERNRISARYFLKGVFQIDVHVPPSPEIEDDLLLSYIRNCPKWLQDVYANNATIAERVKLEGGQDYKLMVKQVGDRVGLELTTDEVVTAWEMCRFETAWWPNETSPWCHIYSQVNLRLMEFREDVHAYYHFGYGNDINLNMTQPIFEDILQKFEEIELGKRNYKAALYFAHGITVSSTLAALGLYHDHQPLQASFWPKTQNYKWKTSFLDSFAANLGLILLQCHSEEENRWKVMVYHQERPVILPACGQQVCTLDQFKKFYRHWAHTDFQTVCKFP